MKKYGVLVETGPLAGLAKRSYFVIDKKGTIRWKNVLENPRELVPNEELLAVLQQIQEEK